YFRESSRFRSNSGTASAVYRDSDEYAEPRGHMVDFTIHYREHHRGWPLYRTLFNRDIPDGHRNRNERGGSPHQRVGHNDADQREWVHLPSADCYRSYQGAEHRPEQFRRFDLRYIQLPRNRRAWRKSAEPEWLRHYFYRRLQRSK